MLRRTRTLAVLEAFNVCWFVLVFFVLLKTPASPATLAGFGLAAALLLQGSAYWELKHRQLRSRARRPRGMRVFRVLRTLNVVVGAPVLLFILVQTWQRPGIHTIPGLLFCALAVLEHINYFHIQLSHDNRADRRRLLRTRRLRRSHLAADLQRAGWPGRPLASRSG